MKNIVLIISDVDGVLTDGKIYFDSFGKEMKVFSVCDSFRIEIWKKSGGRMMWFTGRKSKGTVARARELGVDLVFKQDIKGDLFDYIKKKYKLNRDQVLYVGDDWNDLYYMNEAGIAAVPSNGRKENLLIADVVTQAKGGDGVLSEIIELIMRSKDTWDEASNQYLKKFIL